jgi:hypothetical protein
MHRGGAIADPKEAGRSSEDQSARCAQFSQAVARWRTDGGLGIAAAVRRVRDRPSHSRVRVLGRRQEIQLGVRRQAGCRPLCRPGMLLKPPGRSPCSCGCPPLSGLETDPAAWPSMASNPRSAVIDGIPRLIFASSNVFHAVSGLPALSNA